MKKLAAVLATVMVAGTLMVACGSEEAVVEEVVTTEAAVADKPEKECHCGGGANPMGAGMGMY